MKEDSNYQRRVGGSSVGPFTNHLTLLTWEEIGLPALSLINSNEIAVQVDKTNDVLSARVG